jgi:hypothetical protein
MAHHVETWNETRGLLKEARECVAPGKAARLSVSVPVGRLTGTLDAFEEFLEHNELELAWDELEAVGARVSAPAEFWRKLARAAALMELPDKEAVAVGRAGSRLTREQVLKIAREDAERAYRDLAAYCVDATLESDGWHIDYELKDPRLNGGGPHYVIDAVTGAISSKRYEQ